MTSLINMEKRLIGKILKYNIPTPYVVFFEEQISTVNKLNKTLLWFEQINSLLKTKGVINIWGKNEEQNTFVYNDMCLLIDLYEKKALGGKVYRIYKMLKKEKNVFFILPEGSGELLMYFELLTNN